MSVKIDYQYPPTVGEAIGDIQSIADGEALTIRPAEGVVWVIEMLTYGGACTIAYTDGTLSNTIDTPTAAGAIEKAEYRISHSEYLTITNTSGSPATFGYRGYIVNEA